ncbi:hypothetical protein M758_11G002000 [Ceratodon purpureus]|uniref:Uncharacterized protein n=1 Tax=Ceratodon purpureus TaxID=3225 RepID=A0A8T0GBR7_CERPU|nr:hypothetical protein KC19_11G002700 [Ceratodon purpureus]KAG0600036.1 hypothetical protein M758_11G002000 [Ceratodon purpureus]
MRSLRKLTMIVTFLDTSKSQFPIACANRLQRNWPSVAGLRILSHSTEHQPAASLITARQRRTVSALLRLRHHPTRHLIRYDIRAASPWQLMAPSTGPKARSYCTTMESAALQGNASGH